jgi:hypothetical protein
LGTLLFAKSRLKKQGHFLFKKRRDQAAFIFLNNNDLVFLHSAIFKKQGARFLRIEGAD